MTGAYAIFAHAVESLLRAIMPRMTPRLQARLREAGLDVAHKPLPQYPFTSWREFLRICREAAYPDLPTPEGYRRLGVRFIDGYATTLLGSAMARMARVVGPERTLQKATQNFRSANNFTQTAMTILPDGSRTLWMNGVDDPDFTTGILQRGLELAGAKAINITYRGNIDDAVTFVIRWQ